MADYSPISVSEIDVRNCVSPPLDYDDVSTAEILLKIEMVEIYVKNVFFEGGTIPTDGRIGVLLLIMPNLLTNPSLAKKYCTLSGETLGDYSYQLTKPTSKEGALQPTPLGIIKSWHKMGIELLISLSSSNQYQMRVAND